MKSILFYSNVNLGDLHLSRSYIKWFIDNIPNTNFYYTHNQHQKALCDININLIGMNDLCHKLPRNGDILEVNIDGQNFIAFNTWVHAGGLGVGCNFDACFINFSKYFSYLKNNNFNIDIDILPRLAPKIDFSSPSIKKDTTDAWFKTVGKKPSILICNNMVMSGQSQNFSMNSYIRDLACAFPHINFYVTNHEEPLIHINNVFYVEKIINNKSKFYLNDISYFSQYCDVIVGRGSGPFSFCEIVENIDKIWVSFTFDHLSLDVFNGLNKFSNSGRYIHTMNLSILPELLQEEFS